jgi:TRAP-type mannitol/chloroaromatic compound transport system permease small subunit
VSEEPEGGSADDAEPKLPVATAITDPPLTPREAEDAARESLLTIAPEPHRFPHDSKLSGTVRRIDHAVGAGEQGFVFFLLALVVIVASYAAIHDKLSDLEFVRRHGLLEGHVGRWWHTIVRGGTFCIAMFAAAYTTQEQRHLAMDLVSRKVSPKARLVLGLALKVLTVGVCYYLYKGGRAQLGVVGTGETLSVFGMHINDVDVVTSISIAAILIAFHTTLHFIIDVDYLARGVSPPERARAH